MGKSHCAIDPLATFLPSSLGRRLACLANLLVRCGPADQSNEIHWARILGCAIASSFLPVSRGIAVPPFEIQIHAPSQFFVFAPSTPGSSYLANASSPGASVKLHHVS